jgi:glutaredoxin-related protein
MTDAVHQRIAEIVGANDVVLFMKGTPLFPQCGFSSRAIAILEHLGVAYDTVDVLQDQGLFRLADHPAALCEGRICRRQRHHDGNV